MLVFGVEVDAGRLGRWQDWLAPAVQPFFVESLRSWPKGVPGAGPLSPELRNTYKAWRVDRALKVLWLDERGFFAMPRTERARLVREQVRHRRGAVPTVRGWQDLLDPVALRQQADGHRFVWWPSLLAHEPAAILARSTGTDSLPSRHREVASSTWDRCAHVLPAAQSVAGCFAPSSVANCFGTVMAAAGVAGAAEAWMLQKPFLAWLRAACKPGGRDDEPGTVLLWRDTSGLPVHAAVTIGDGWALEKPSQEWTTPRVVLGVRDLIRVNRWPGKRLERHRITHPS